MVEKRCANDDGRFALHQTVESLKDEFFGSGVESGTGLVHYQDGQRVALLPDSGRSRRLKNGLAVDPTSQDDGSAAQCSSCANCGGGELTSSAGWFGYRSVIRGGER